MDHRYHTKNDPSMDHPGKSCHHHHPLLPPRKRQGAGRTSKSLTFFALHGGPGQLVAAWLKPGR